MESENDVLVALNQALWNGGVEFYGKQAYKSLNPVVFQAENVLEAITDALRTAYEEKEGPIVLGMPCTNPTQQFALKFEEGNEFSADLIQKNSYRVHFLAKSVQLVNDVKTALNPENPEAYNEDHLQTLVDNFVLAMKGGKLTEYKEGEQADVPLALNPKPLVGYNTQMNQLYDRTNITDGNRVWSIENAVNKLENALKEQIEASQ